MGRHIIITGAAGFIGFHLCKKLIDDGLQVLGIDNVNNYYDQKLKERRLDILNEKSCKIKNWKFIKSDLQNKDILLQTFQEYKPECVVNLAAQAGVRY